MSSTPLFQRIRLADSDHCPCSIPGDGASSAEGTVVTYGDCCAPLHRFERQAETAVELMRARYSAYAAHEADYLWKTWHPRRRPELITFDDGVEWLGLEILDTVDGGVGQRSGIVEFRAYFTDAQGRGEFWERSTFEMRAKRWMYIEGDVSIDNVALNRK
ncbi:YchJ family protein [Corynebacterium sp. H78]|uniref:YchJ family protein n=1 Tax=Corynebacterium sp. H78 TaxID=3133417 RepID=UPI003098A118